MVNFEICTLLRNNNSKPILWYIQATTLAIFISIPFSLGFDILSNYIGGAAIIFLLFSIIKDPYGDYFKKSVLPTVAIIFIVPMMLKFYALIASWGASHVGYKNIMLAVWFIMATKFSDVGAYAIGCAFGRHKMAPTMSPNKSWEGAVGGVISSAVIGATFAWLCSLAGIWYSQITPVVAALISIPIGIIAIISDLLESVFKRRMEVKDSGAIIPGIGGALDLADSLILTAPFAYVMFIILALFSK